MKIYKILINKLHFQYVPSKFIKQVYPGDNEVMMRVDNSPHYKFAKLYSGIGEDIWKCYKDTDYIKLMTAWDRGDKHNKWKTKRFLRTYNSIKKKGFKGVITVMVGAKHKQFFKSGYEIVHGHHRAAICCSLGIKKMSCKVMK